MRVGLWNGHEDAPAEARAQRLSQCSLDQAEQPEQEKDHDKNNDDPNNAARSTHVSIHSILLIPHKPTPPVYTWGACTTLTSSSGSLASVRRW